jgi:cell surface protein SprA
VDGKFNFETLYNKSSYLKEVNRKFSSTRTSQRKKPLKNYDQTLTLKKGEAVKVRHRLNDKNARVKATANGKKYKVKYKVIDANTIEITPKEDIEIALNVQTGGNQPAGNVALDVTTRVLMLLRNVSFNYAQTDGTSLPGFKPGVTCLGLTSYNDITAPGWDFVFGIQSDDILNRALDNDWLITSDAIYNPVQFIHNETFKATALVEPFPGFKINVAADRQLVENRDVKLSADNQLTTLNGSFSMSYVAIGTAFAGNGTELFNRFMAYRSAIQNRLQQTYLPNTPYRLNSDDVLIPAFLAAYGGRNVEGVSLAPIPNFWSFLPNWQVSCNALMRIPWFKEKFRNVNITHAYTCKYQIGSYNADQTFVAVDGDYFGYIEDVLTGGTTPSSRYTFNAVTINEQFSPLIGLDVNMKNSFSIKAEWRKGRNMGLNLSSNQLIESHNNEYVIGVGYKFSDLKFSMRQGQSSKQVNNDLTLRADFSIKDTKTMVHKIDLNESQATAGDWVTTFKFLANYVFSERISFNLFYDLQLRNPVVSTSYPTTISEVGVSVKVLLTR